MTRRVCARSGIAAATGLLFVILCAGPPSVAQVSENAAALAHDARVEWLARNAVKVRSGDPRNEDFRDLAPLRQSIGDARIVMLGDSSHMGGGSFLAMSRLVKFLHRDMGFDVLVFESGLYDMSKVWESLGTGGDVPAALAQGLMPAWRTSEEVHSLIDYVVANVRSKRPLELAGWDPQITGRASREHLMAELAAFANERQITSGLLVGNGTSRVILENLLAGKYMSGTAAPGATEQKEYLLLLDQLAKDLAANGPGRDNMRARFWALALRNLKVCSQMTWMPRDEASQWEGSMLRDAQGAVNLLWLANERYRGHKIVVWAATFHEFRNKGFVMSPDVAVAPADARYMNTVTMGQHVWDSLGSRVYVIGFTAYGGSHGWFRGGKSEAYGPIRQGPHTSVEMEELFNAAGFQYGFLDFKSPRKGGDWLTTPISARYLGDSPGLRNWTKAMDAMFFIREQQPNTEWIVRPQ